MEKIIDSPKVQKSNCRFQASTSEDGKPAIRVDLFQNVSSLAGFTIEFELMGGISPQQAKALAESINDKILGVVVTKS